MKDTGSHDLTVGAARTSQRTPYRVNLIDECQHFICPLVVGRGKQSLPGDLRGELEPLDARRFDNGVVYLRHRIVI